MSTRTAGASASTPHITRRSDAAEKRLVLLKRFAACMALALVLAVMIGTQEGTQQDFGYAFRQAVLGPRILGFLVVGVLIFVAVTFWPYLTPYLRRPGVRPLAAGALSVVAAYGLLKWTDSDQIDTGKLGTLATAGRDTASLGAVTRLFFGSAVPGLYWLLLVVTVVLGVAALVRRSPALCYATVAVAVVVGVWGCSAPPTTPPAGWSRCSAT
jgi:hypothetical protein